MKSNIYRTISKSCEEAGNTIDNKGKPVTADVLLEMLAKIQTDFDEAGNPHIPQIHCHPDKRETLEAVMRTLTTDSIYRAAAHRL